MAGFTREGGKNVYVEMEMDFNISVSEFHGEMNSEENKEMASLLIEDGDLDIIDILSSEPETEIKEKFYKDLAYYVGVTDTEFLNNFIEELQTWKR